MASTNRRTKHVESQSLMLSVRFLLSKEVILFPWDSGIHKNIDLQNNSIQRTNTVLQRRCWQLPETITPHPHHNPLPCIVRFLSYCLFASLKMTQTQQQSCFFLAHSFPFPYYFIYLLIQLNINFLEQRCSPSQVTCSGVLLYSLSSCSFLRLSWPASKTGIFRSVPGAARILASLAQM